MLADFVREIGLIHYRRDIDGLRALAVLAVVLYHFSIGPFAGGFVGVDVFFVISGYLITGIIQKEIDANRFTFVGFYERRVRRLFPALFAMLLVTLVMGYFFLLPSDLLKLGGNTLSTLLFVSNIWYWRQSGYFDSSSDLNPLLHTWSLAVEEQFYIGLPILLLLVARFARAHLKSVLLGLALLSFCACVLVQSLQAKATFFLAPFRAWELLIGAWLAVGGCSVVRPGKVREVAAAVALSVLIASFLWIPEGISFPGWIAIFPVTATAALLHLGKDSGTSIHRWLSWRPVVGIGLVSYSWYLWHFPILVIAHYQNAMEQLPSMDRAGWMCISLVLAIASFRWVESPFRRRQVERSPAGARNAVVAGFAASLVVALCALAARQDGGWQSRVPTAVLSLDESRLPVIPYQRCDEKGPQPANLNCIIGKHDSLELALIWGDSHALAWAPGLDALFEREGLKGVLAVNSACAPLLGLRNPKDPSCKDDNEKVLSWLKLNHVKRLYLIAAWTAWSMPGEGYDLSNEEGLRGNDKIFPPSLERTINAAEPFADRIILVGPTPEAPRELPLRLALHRWKGTPIPAPVTLEDVTQKNRWFWRAVDSLPENLMLQRIDPTAWFCRRKDCVYTGSAGRLLYRDGHHLSVAGARFAADRLEESPVSTAIKGVH